MTIEVISSPNCGATGRVLAALIAKDLPYTVRLVSVEDKRNSDEFKSLNPYRKTPVLYTGDQYVFESIVICEYLEDIAPEIPLLPTTPSDRAMARAWIHYGDVGIIEAFRSVLDEDMKVVPDGAASLERALEKVNTRLKNVGYSGHHWSGASLGLVDIFYSGLFRGLDLLKEEYSYAPECKLDEFFAWKDQVQKAPTIISALKRLAEIRGD